MSEPFIVAAAQAAPVFLDREATIAKAARLAQEAAANGARLIAFPEAFVSGWPAWVFEAAGWEDAAAKRAFRALAESSLELPSAQLDPLLQVAREHQIVIVLGANERGTAPVDGTIYSSLVYIDSDGQLRGSHRKLVPTHAERLVWGAGDGSTLHVFDTAVGRVGGLICWEHWMPLARFAMHSKGEQIHVAAWPDVIDVHELANRSYAFEGRCFVICASSYMTVADIPETFPLFAEMTGQAEDGVLLPGGSGIIGPDGHWIEGPLYGSEGIVYGEVDLGRIAEEHASFDSVGHYHRPDVFRVQIDQRPRPAADWILADRPELA